MENQPFEDVSPTKSGDFRCHISFREANCWNMNICWPLVGHQQFESWPISWQPSAVGGSRNPNRCGSTLQKKLLWRTFSPIFTSLGFQTPKREEMVGPQKHI